MLRMQTSGMKIVEACNIGTSAGVVKSWLSRHRGMVRLHHNGTKWQHEGGDLPEHLQKRPIPPAWKDVHASLDPKADLQVRGLDEKGRRVGTYSHEFTQRMADQKFSRNHELLQKRDAVFKQNEDNTKHSDSKIRENASVMKLIHHTGIRPGSETDTGAEKQAYGATTLQGRHVHVDEHGAVSLKFVGKKGVDLNIPVDHAGTAQMLKERKASAGDKGKLFHTDDASLRQYSHTLDGGSFKPKDFRTLKGTETAMKELGDNPPRAKTIKEYKQRVMEVAKKVAEKLGNTPKIALQSYIHPSVFHKIQPV